MFDQKIFILYYLSFFIILIQGATVPPPQQLECYCTINYAADGCYNDTCTTTGYCYVFVEEVYDDNEDGFVDEYTFGCLQPEEGGYMQCKSHLTPHKDPKNITCCHNSNRCNRDLLPHYLRTPDQIRLYGMIIGFIPYILLAICIVAFLILCACFVKYSRKGKLCLNLKRQKLSLNDKDCMSTTKCTSVSDDISKEKLSLCDGSLMFDELTSGLGTRELVQLTVGKEIILDENGEIGHGRFGRVVKGNLSGTPVAVKIFSSIDEESWKRERYIYDQCIKNHENILGYYAADIISMNGNVEFWLITHYCKHRSLYEFLNVHDELITESQALKILYSIIDGLNYLHKESSGCGFIIKPSIAHRDIKSKNILMKSKSVCCIADFGHAVINMPDGTINRGHPYDLRVGTKRYMAPEVLEQTMDPNKFSSYAMSDVYQFALVMWEICNRIGVNAQGYLLPYGDVVPADPSFEDMVKVVCIDQYRPPLREGVNFVMTTLNQIMEECWRPTPRARCTTLRIKKKIQELQESYSPRLNYKSECSGSEYGSSGYYGDDGVPL